MNQKLSSAALRLEGQPMFQLLDRAKQLESQGKSILHFEIGDPDFSTPKSIVQACIDSLHHGETHYTSSYGLDELRETIADYTLTDLGFLPRKEQIVISPGANALIYFVIQCLVKEDEEVIVPDPAFSTYYSVLKLLNLKTVRIPLKEENHFRMSPADIRESITPQTKLIIINSPQNPTGSVMTKAEIEEIARIAEEYDVFILSDEIYRLMSYSIKPTSPAEYDHSLKRTIIMTGFSKTFAMTGWRLGYLLGPSWLVDKISLLLQTIVSCVPAFIQKAGIAVLKENHPEVERMNKELKRRRKVIIEGLQTLPGVSCVMPEGAFYAFANIKNTGMTSQEFAELMLEEAGVALLPGPNFGENAEGYVRLCYAVSVENIREGIKRMHEVLERRVVCV